ncbi:Penta-EF hand domain-containing protein 2 [Diplonema papillatum]|nr:Penta-EF hand domain-containing protein 2 [Diplonema papillatum]
MAAEADGMEQLKEWFDYVDRDSSGKLDGNELITALMQAGLNFSPMSANMMLKLFDDRREGKLSFEQFCKLYSWILEQKRAFMEFDDDKSGTLDLNNGEVLHAIFAAGFKLDTHSFNAAFKAYDPDCDERMSTTEFVGLCAFLTLCLNTFCSFDPYNTGDIKVNFCQFVYACASCK